MANIVQAGGESHKAKFDVALPLFKKSVEESMVHAKACADNAILHFEEYGDCTLLQRFYEAMPENYSRRSAFLKWAREHSPLASKGGKFYKDSGPNAVPFNTATAVETPFWDYTPDKVIETFASTDLIKAVDAIIKRFEERPPKDDSASAALVSLKNARAHIPVGNLSTATH